MGSKNGPRIYGTPDPKDQKPPPAEGLRGERATPLNDDSPPELMHTLDTSEGPLVVQETSGSGFVESTGKEGSKQGEGDHEDDGAEGAT